MPAEVLYSIIAALVGIVLALIARVWTAKGSGDGAKFQLLFAKLDDLRTLMHGIETGLRSEQSTIRERVARLEERVGRMEQGERIS